MRALGILNLYKEKGYTSHDVVAIVRKTLGRIKTGHTGTLDPEAEGVLPVCVGRATKLAELIAGFDKSYRAELVLGKTTDTQDLTGHVLSEKKVCFDQEAIEKAVYGFRGAYSQVPPMYSAIKVNGQKLYRLAREGKTIERKERPVYIHDIKILDFFAEENKLLIDVTCSKGTYIRTLCADIGDILGCGGCMGKLLRTRVGSFVLADSIRLDKLKQLAADDLADQALLPVDSVLGYRRVTVKEEGLKGLMNGNPVGFRFFAEEMDWQTDERFFVYKPGDSEDPVGIYIADPAKEILRPAVMLKS